MATVRARAARAAVAAVNRLARTSRLVLEEIDAPAVVGPSYSLDGLSTDHNHDFLQDERFRAAYQRAVQAGGFDFGIPWRVHVALWVAEQASHLEGSFVECGVGRGFISSAVLQHLPWESLAKDFYLFDTFTPHNVQVDAASEQRPHYAADVATVSSNFAEWSRVHLVPGRVPDTLGSIAVGSVAYLHVDMNHPDPEVAAVRWFWPKLVTGGWLLLDDYAYAGCEPQKQAMDEVAADLGFTILSLPTGQGLAVKHGRSSSAVSGGG